MTLTVPFDIGAIPLREVHKTIFEPELMTKRIYAANRQSGMNHKQSYAVALEAMPQIERSVYEACKVICDQYEKIYL